VKKNTAIVINDKPPISINIAITILSYNVNSDKVSTDKPVTQTALVAWNNACTKPIDLYPGNVKGNHNNIVPNTITLTNESIMNKYGCTFLLRVLNIKLYLTINYTTIEKKIH
jgi:hypothetical protein